MHEVGKSFSTRFSWIFHIAMLPRSWWYYGKRYPAKLCRYGQYVNFFPPFPWHAFLFSFVGFFFFRFPTPLNLYRNSSACQPFHGKITLYFHRSECYTGTRISRTSTTCAFRLCIFVLSCNTTFPVGASLVTFYHHVHILELIPFRRLWDYNEGSVYHL